MSTITLYVGKASDLQTVETIHAQPNRIESRKVVAGYYAFTLANKLHEAGDFSPLTRVIASDGVRNLAGVYVSNFEKTLV